MLYGRVALGSVFGLEAVAGRSDLDLDSRRFLGGPEAVLGQREGDTTFAGIGVSGQWMFGEGGIGPYVRYERARTTLDGYAESANPLALQYGRLETRNSALVAGAEAFYGIRYGWGTLTPKVRVEYRDRSVRAANQAMWYLDTPGTQYVLGLPGMDDRTALATFGVEAAFRGLTLTLEYGSAGSAGDWFDGQTLRFGLRAGF